jgi:plasmid stability protein
MANLTVKQIPGELVDRLKERARLTGRSMNREIIACLELVLMPREKTAEERIAERKALWNSLGLRDIGAYDPGWKREGRP